MYKRVFDIHGWKLSTYTLTSRLTNACAEWAAWIP